MSDTYRPTDTGRPEQDRENQSIARALSQVNQIPIWNKEPERFPYGMIFATRAGAWDPGSGTGIYYGGYDGIYRRLDITGNTYLGLYDQIVNLPVLACPPPPVIGAGDYYILSVNGVFATACPGVAGLTGSIGDTLIWSGTTWGLISVGSHYLSSVVADTANGKLALAAGGSSAIPPVASADLARKAEIDALDARLSTLEGLLTLEDGMLPVKFPTDGPNFDAFDRLRISHPETLFDSKQCFDNAPLVFDDQEASGSGTSSTHSAVTASTVMGVAASTAGKRVRQTFMWFNYQPGKSHLVFLTGTLQNSGGGPGIKSGFGYYNDANGFFLQDDQGTPKLVRRSSTSGAAVDEAVTQAAWNLDPMDGTGPSGYTLDFTKTQILILDFEWLGVGRCRMGFVVNGIIYYAHQFVHANVLDVVYMSTPNLPIRYEIENTGAGVASTLEHICASVISEGGADKNGILHHTDSDRINGMSTGIAYAMLAGRLKSGYLGASVIIESASMVALTNDSCSWHFVVGATVAGTLTFVDHPNSAVQIAKGGIANTVTGGVYVDGGFFTQSLAAQFNTPNALRLGSAIDGTPQEWVLVAEPITNNLAAKASVTWRELL